MSRIVGQSRRGLRYCTILVSCLLVAGCWKSGDIEIHKTSHLLMGTLVEISIVDKRERAVKAARLALEEMKRIERLTSFHMQGSELKEMNARAGQGPVKVSKELFELIRFSVGLARNCSSSFDPSIGAVSALWGFSTGSPRPPEKRELEKAIENSGVDKINLDEDAHTLSLPQGLAVDLGAIAKGYALDRAESVLRQQGITSALINAGGDIIAIGGKGQGNEWKIGVQDPDKSRSILAVIPIRDRAVVTSGNYERFFEKDGVRYHHILNPKTGYPARGLKSVTVIANDGATADAMATAVFVLGVEKGMKLLNSRKDLHGMIVDNSNQTHISLNADKIFDIKRR